jgi:hypothetical protein
MNRRSFLRGLVAAPAVVAAGSLMKIVPVPAIAAPLRYILTPAMIAREAELLLLHELEELQRLRVPSLRSIVSSRIDQHTVDGVPCVHIDVRDPVKNSWHGVDFALTATDFEQPLEKIRTGIIEPGVACLVDLHETPGLTWSHSIESLDRFDRYAPLGAHPAPAVARAT